MIRQCSKIAFVFISGGNINKWKREIEKEKEREVEKSRKEKRAEGYTCGPVLLLLLLSNNREGYYQSFTRFLGTKNI